jgi:hypothetical protein
VSAEPPPLHVSPDGKFYWDGTRWVAMQASLAPEPQASQEQPPVPRRPGAVVPAIYIVAGTVTLFLALIAYGLGGDSGPTTMDLAVLASWVGLAVALVAAGVGFALGKGWGYWIGTIGVLIPSTVTPWSLFESSHSVSSNSSVAIGPGSVAPHDAATYYSVFLASLVVALIAVGFRRRWVRLLAIPAIIFMAISCFELPAAAALVAGLSLGGTSKQAMGYFKGFLKAAVDPNIRLLP